MKNPLHNPLPASLSSECKKAAAIIESFINPKLKIDGGIPRKIFAGAKGIAVFTAFRVGFLGSVRFGSGLIVARLPDGSWSAPSAMAMGGVGAGGQFGAELTDFVFVLTTDAAVKTFMQSGNLTLGGNISMAVGPIGRSAEAGGVVGAKGAAGVFAYSKTRGLYGGVTVEGGVLAERADANKKLYGRKVRARELLSGLVPPPPEAGDLLEVLNGEFFRVEISEETATEGAAVVPCADAETVAQAPSEQPQQTSAPVPDQAAAPELGAEQTSGTTVALTGCSHGTAETSTAQESTQGVESKATTGLATKEATGDAEKPRQETDDVPGASAQEHTPTADHVSAAELNAQTALGKTHDTVRESEISEPTTNTELSSNVQGTAPGAAR